MLRGAKLYDVSVLHYRHPVPERERLVQIVRDEDDGPLRLALDVQEEVLHVAPNERIQSAEGLVHQEYLLLGSEGTGEPDPLLHAAGELRYELVALSLQADLREDLLGLLPALLRGDALDLEAEGDVVEDCPVGQEPEVLEDHADLPAPDLPELLGRHLGDQLAVEVDLPLGRLVQAVDGPQDRGLPAPQIGRASCRERV